MEYLTFVSWLPETAWKYCLQTVLQSVCPVQHTPQQMLNAHICWALWIPYSFSGQESNQGTLECLHGCLHNEGTTDFSHQASQTWKTEAKSWPDHSNFMVVGRTLSAPSAENTTYKWPHTKPYLPSPVSGLKWSPPCRWNATLYVITMLHASTDPKHFLLQKPQHKRSIVRFPWGARRHGLRSVQPF